MKPNPLYFVWEYNDTDRRFWEEQMQDWLPSRIFDAHVHINEPRFRLEIPTEQMRKQYWVNEVAEPMGVQTAEQCYKTVFPDRELSCLAFGHPELAYDLKGSNSELQKQCQVRHWHSLAVVRPQWSASEVEALVDLPGVLGIKVYYALISSDPISRDKHLEDSIFDFLPHHQLEVLNARRSWVTLHVPKADRLGHRDNIREIKEIRRRYPDVTLVIAHLGRSYTLAHAQEALPQLADDPGLYFDNSAVLNPQVHRYALDILGSERILYGTDNPIFYMRGRRQWQDRTYRNRTNHPFHFNKDRESPQLESNYTLYMYEALRGIKWACEDLGFGRSQIEALFHDNARQLIARIESVKP